MPWFIFVLGLALAIAGGASVVHGYPYMQIEFGWTEVIAGTTAVSGGIVTIALGAVVLGLASLRRSIDRTRGAPSSVMVAEPSPPVAIVEPSPASAAVAVELPPESLSLPSAASPMDVPAKPERFRDRSATRSFSASRSSKTSSASIAAETETPTVAGRYESGGASYVLFSDGTIDVESEGGNRHFASMDELKSFMAREPSEPVKAEPAR